MMQVKALKLPFRTGMPTQAYRLVNVIVIDGGSNCKGGLGTSGYRVERRSLSDVCLVLLEGHDCSCEVTSGAARLQLLK